jgi:hypothetical protein
MRLSWKQGLDSLLSSEEILPYIALYEFCSSFVSFVAFFTANRPNVSEFGPNRLPVISVKRPFGHLDGLSEITLR